MGSIYHHQIIIMRIQDSVHEIAKHCNKFHVAHFSLQTEVITGRINHFLRIQQYVQH